MEHSPLPIIDLAALGVDEMDIALKTASQQVVGHCRADRAGAHAGPDRHDRFRCHELVEVAGALLLQLVHNSLQLFLLLLQFFLVAGN